MPSRRSCTRAASCNPTVCQSASRRPQSLILTTAPVCSRLSCCTTRARPISGKLMWFPCLKYCVRASRLGFWWELACFSQSCDCACGESVQPAFFAPFKIIHTMCDERPDYFIAKCSARSLLEIRPACRSRCFCPADFSVVLVGFMPHMVSPLSTELVSTLVESFRSVLELAVLELVTNFLKKVDMVGKAICCRSC